MSANSRNTEIKRTKQSDPELPVTPMLDMAFQLLTFFILTYHPQPTEGQFSMNLMPAAPVVPMNNAAPPDPSKVDADVPASLRTMTTQLVAAPDGSLGRIIWEEQSLPGLDGLRAKLKEILDPSKDLAFEQALVQSDPNLRYEELMKVIDVFAQPDPANPKMSITKISFSELNLTSAGIAP